MAKTIESVMAPSRIFQKYPRKFTLMYSYMLSEITYAMHSFRVLILLWHMYVYYYYRNLLSPET